MTTTNATTTARPMPGRPDDWKMTPQGVGAIAREGRVSLAYTLALQLKRERQEKAALPPSVPTTGRQKVLSQREHMLAMAAGVH